MGSKITDLSTITGATVVNNDVFPIVDVSAGTSGSKKITSAELLNALGVVNAAGTPLTGANTATNDQFAIYDVSATATKFQTVAETEVAIRNAATSARMVSLAATTLTITQALHDGRVVKLNHTGASSTVTLPDATGSGMWVDFYVGAVNTSNHIIKVPDSSNVLKGTLNILDNDGASQGAYSASGTDDTITLNGTTTGGQIGDWIRVLDLATDTWAIQGNLTVPTGSNPADPLSATV